MAALGPLLGVNQQHPKSFGQPSSSTDSQQTFDSPRANLCGIAAARSTPDVLCTEYGFGRVDGHTAWGNHQHALQGHNVYHPQKSAIAMLTSASPAAIAAALNQIPDDPAAAKAAFQQLTSHMSPAEMTELQELLREQRLQRQQQDMLAMVSTGAPAVPALGIPAGPLTPGLPAAVPSLDPNQFAGMFQQGLNPADAMRLIGEMAVALNAVMAQPGNSNSNPAHFAGHLADMASQLAMHQLAPTQYQQAPQQQQQQQQQYPSPVTPAVQQSAPAGLKTAGPAPAAVAAAGTQHPGIASCRGTRSSSSRKPKTSFEPFFWNRSTPSPAAAAAAVNTAVPVSPAAEDVTAEAIAAAAAVAAGEAAGGCSLKARFARLSAEAQASIMAQLQQLEASEEERRGAKEGRRTVREAAAVAANEQRRSKRARRPKSPEDAENMFTANNTNRSVSPDPAAAAAAAADRPGSAEANNSAADPAAAAAQQHQQPAKKRVRFAFADDDDDESDGEAYDNKAAAAAKKAHGSSSESPQVHGLDLFGDLPVFMLEDGEEQVPVRRIVRRVGPRAQARKRMHKKTIRRRRPQRAPLS